MAKTKTEKYTVKERKAFAAGCRCGACQAVKRSMSGAKKAKGGKK